jgi:hypothetical protein
MTENMKHHWLVIGCSLTVIVWLLLIPQLGTAENIDRPVQHGAESAIGRGLWLLPRKDTSNWGRCDLPGRFHAALNKFELVGSQAAQQVDKIVFMRLE